MSDIPLRAITQLVGNIFKPSWQPIETAPKDGWFLAFRDNRIILCHWDDDRYATTKPKPFWGGSDYPRGMRFMRDCTPTHWMPLPEPPTGEQS